MTAKRELKKLRLNYRINNGKTKTVNVSEWRGGERYGHEMKRTTPSSAARSRARAPATA